MNLPHIDTPRPDIGQLPLEEVAPLVGVGFAVHWLRPRSKAPVAKAWTTEPVHTVEELRASYRPGYNLGVRLGAPSRVEGLHLYLIDLDIREASLADQARARLSDFLPAFASLPTVASGSGGASRHFYFLTDGEFRSRKLAHSAAKVRDGEGREHWAWEIELFGTGKQAVLPPSIHPDTGLPYRWAREFDLEMLAMGVVPFVPAAVVRAWAPEAPLVSPGAPSDDDDGFAQQVHSEPLALSEAEIQATLDALPTAEWCDDRDGWLAVGMALHHQYGGSSAGLERWNTFSRRSPKFNAKDSARVWRSFATKPGGRTFATLLEAAGGLEKPGPEDSQGGDIEAGRAFAERYKGRFLHVLASRTWYRWTETIWASCRQGEEVEAGKALAKEMMEASFAAYRTNATDGNKARHKIAMGLWRSAPKLNAMLAMAATEPAVVTTPDAFDRNSMLLGVKNGVLCLRTGQLLTPHPDQRISRQSRASFDAEARAPTWDAFIERIHPDLNKREFIRRAVGYTLTGSIDEEKVFFAHGTGANGKSVFANVLAAILGDFAVTVGSKLLTKSFNTSEADRLVNRLPGARLALANETAQGDVWDAQRVKELASREEIPARPLYGEAFSFTPTHKLWIRGNHLPGSHDAGDGFWRRMIPIPFDQQIPPAERVADLDRRIIAGELSGVLNWALKGCLQWQADGLAIPPEVQREIDSYRAETDVLGLWLDERVERASDARLPVGLAFKSYVEFCSEQRIKPPAKVEFGRQMKAKGLGEGGSRKQGRQIPGLRLKSGFDHWSGVDLGEADLLG